MTDVTSSTASEQVDFGGASAVTDMLDLRPGRIGVQCRVNCQPQVRVSAAGHGDEGVAVGVEQAVTDVTVRAGLRGNGVALVVGQGFGGAGAGSAEQAGRNSSAASSITERPIMHVT